MSPDSVPRIMCPYTSSEPLVFGSTIVQSVVLVSITGPKFLFSATLISIHFGKNFLRRDLSTFPPGQKYCTPTGRLHLMTASCSGGKHAGCPKNCCARIGE